MNHKEIKDFIGDFHAEMDKGLKGAKSSLKMLPVYVDKPTQKEKGRFVALDLGGTNFRVIYLELLGNGKEKPPKVKSYKLEKKYITGDGKQLFGFIAGCIKGFLKEERLTGEDIKIGFTFSFAVAQTKVDEGKLLHWTKGFKAKNVVGRDVVKLLNLALRDSGLDGVKVAALANDTVGTLVARAYLDRACDVGVIIGTGTNACYRERISKIRKLRSGDKKGFMIVNTEWGNFNKIKRNKYDRELDKNTQNPGSQLLEKMISGMYLGELARLTIKDLIDKGILKRMKGRVFSIPYSFDSKDMSYIESDRSKSLKGIEGFLKKNGIRYSFHEDRAMLREIIRLISSRAAVLSAAAMVAVVTKMDPALLRKHTVAIDGSIFEKYFEFKSRMDIFLRQYLGKKAKKIKIVLAKDGSGKGAAVIAAVASKI